jgi:hypothetical protein
MTGQRMQSHVGVVAVQNKESVKSFKPDLACLANLILVKFYVGGFM